jgi:hypothetical protein
MGLAWIGRRRSPKTAPQAANEAASQELHDLLSDLHETDAKLWDRFNAQTGRYQFSLGPLHLSYQAGSQTIVRWFIAFALVCFVGGVVATLFDPTKELGIALIVGTIFAGGSFIVQVWTHQIQKESDFYESIYGEEERQELHAILQHRRELADRIDALSPGGLRSQARAHTADGQQRSRSGRTQAVGGRPASTNDDQR